MLLAHNSNGDMVRKGFSQPANERKWCGSKKERFWSEVQKNNAHIFQDIKGVVDTLCSREDKQADLWYGISPDTELQNILLCTKEERTVLCLSSAGILRIYCKGPTIWHRVHRTLLKKLQNERLFGQRSGREKEWFQINIARPTASKIDVLCKAYREAMGSGFNKVRP